RIRVVRTHWAEPSDTYTWYVPLKDTQRRLGKTKWCLHLNANEFIPEGEFTELRQYIASAKEDLIPFHSINFYGNYKAFHAQPKSLHWPTRKMILHRNRPDIEFWGDGSNVKLSGQEFDWNCSPANFTCHHFGTVRNPARLRQKWHIQGAMY